MSRVPVTPENPLGLVIYDGICTSGVARKPCPICGRVIGLFRIPDGRLCFNGHHRMDGGKPRSRNLRGDCPGSRMILEEYQPVTLEGCNRKLDEILEDLEG